MKKTETLREVLVCGVAGALAVEISEDGASARVMARGLPFIKWCNGENGWGLYAVGEGVPEFIMCEPLEPCPGGLRVLTWIHRMGQRLRGGIDLFRAAHEYVGAWQVISMHRISRTEEPS